MFVLGRTKRCRHLKNIFFTLYSHPLDYACSFTINMYIFLAILLLQGGLSYDCFLLTAGALFNQFKKVSMYPEIFCQFRMK